MTLIEAIALMGRRWRLSLIGLVLTAIGAILASTSINPSYSATAQVAIIPSSFTSSTTGQVFRVNPYEEFNSAVRISAEILARQMMDGATQKTFSTNFNGSSYEVTVPALTGTSAPVLVITAKSANASSAVSLLDAVKAQVSARFNATQAASEVPSGQRLSVLPLAETAPIANRKAGLAVTVLVAVIGLAFTGASILVLELRRRKRGEDAANHGWPTAAARDPRPGPGAIPSTSVARGSSLRWPMSDDTMVVEGKTRNSFDE